VVGGINLGGSIKQVHNPIDVVEHARVHFIGNGHLCLLAERAVGKEGR
jgi:hypothetical protein